jgi:hypothetical protein
MLGDAVETCLERLGVTPASVERWLGRDCGGCAERKRRLNQLDRWARTAAKAGIEESKRWLTAMLGE